MSSENMFGDVIYAYSRQQAIADGVLVDLSHVTTIRQHWKYPFACTSTVWALIETALQIEGQDIEGISHDLSMTAKVALRGRRDSAQVLFNVILGKVTERLKLHVGPGDTGEPVLTLMLRHED